MSKVLVIILVVICAVTLSNPALTGTALGEKIVGSDSLFYTTLHTFKPIVNSAKMFKDMASSILSWVLKAKKDFEDFFNINISAIHCGYISNIVTSDNVFFTGTVSKLPDSYGVDTVIYFMNEGFLAEKNYYVYKTYFSYFGKNISGFFACDNNGEVYYNTIDYISIDLIWHYQKPASGGGGGGGSW